MVLDEILELFNKIKPCCDKHLKSSKNSVKLNHFKFQIQYIFSHLFMKSSFFCQHAPNVLLSFRTYHFFLSLIIFDYPHIYYYTTLTNHVNVLDIKIV